MQFLILYVYFDIIVSIMGSDITKNTLRVPSVKFLCNGRTIVGRTETCRHYNKEN